MADTLITDRRSATATYRILRRLGKGGMAEVFLAHQEGMAGFARLAVVKKILPQFSAASTVAKMLLDEARIAAQLNHPNVVQIYELGKEGSQYFIAMEYVDGCDLATLARIERHKNPPGRVPMRLALRVVSEAAMGLDYAHRQVGLDGRPLNIVHRDVSPHNILCSREGAVKVTDFGIAKAVGKQQVTEAGVVKGKVQYMAPEQYTGAELDRRADIFSLGVVLYQLTTGKLPRATSGGNLSMRKVIEGNIPRPSELRSEYPEQLEMIVMRALAHNPRERYPDAAQLRDDLLDFARLHDMLAFPKELGDYINAVVPAQSNSVVVEEAGPPSVELANERSRAAMGSLSAAEVDLAAPAQRSTMSTLQRRTNRERENSPVKDGAAQESPRPTRTAAMVDTPRPRTEAVDRSGVRSVITSDGRSDPFGDTEMRGLMEKKRLAAAAADADADADESSSVADPEASIASLAAATVEPRAAPSTERAGRGRGSPSRGRKPSGGQPSRKSNGKASAKPGDMGEIREPAFVKAARFPAAASSPRRSSTTLALVQRQPMALLIGLSVVAAAGLGIGIYAVATRGDTHDGAGYAGSGKQPALAGVIDVMANPAEVKVAIDGARHCAMTPCHVPGLPLNQQLLITVRAEGYSVWMRRVVLSGELPKLVLTPKLVKLDDLAKAASQKKARASGGAKRKTKAKASSGGSKPRRSGGGTRPSVSRPRRGKGKVVTVKIAVPRALIVIDVRPFWAEIWVDGQKVGHTPKQFELPPGRHKIELKNEKRGFHRLYRVRAKKGFKIKISETVKPKPK